MIEEIIIKNYTEKAVKEFNWKGTLPSEIVWDGRDEKGSPLEEGIFNYTIVGKDTAGNVSEKRFQE